MQAFENIQLPELEDNWVPVHLDELARLLQMPGAEAFDDDMRQSISEVEKWHQSNVSVWHCKHARAIRSIGEDHVLFEDGSRLPIGGSFKKRLEASGARSIILLAYTVGSETDARATTLWDEDRLDESYLVKIYGATLAEELRSHYMLSLCDWAADRDLSLLPPEGPGYNDWPTSQMEDLYALLLDRHASRLSDRIKLHPGGMLEPANSMLLAFGLTSYSGLDQIERRELYPCVDCTCSPCAFRRTPYRPG
jgi:hypothetical protein